MKSYPLSLIDEENDDNSHISPNHLKKLKSLGEDDTSTENTYNTFNTLKQKNIKEKKIIFDFRNKFKNEGNLIDDDKEEQGSKKDINDNNNNNNEQKKENITNKLIEKKEKKFSYHGKIYFFSVCIMLIYQYLSYIYLIEIPIIFTNKLNLLYLIRIIIFHILIILLSLSLYMTSKTNPGTTPLYWGFHIGDEDFKKKRYCLLCQVFKPERTHHCSICNLCILNMDHHCPWVDNCIGFYNKKFFIQLLCYFLLTSICLCITYFPYSFDVIKKIYDNKNNINEIIDNYNYIYLINNIILFAFCIIDFNFLKFHIKLIISNLTTIETLDTDLMQNKKYDMGFEVNFKQIFGDNKLLWFLPINLPVGYPNGDGLTWPTKFDLISLDNLNNEIINENTIDNTNNVIDEKKINTNTQTRASSTVDNNLTVNRFSANYSKYNVVKRNSGKNNMNIIDSVSTKKTLGKSDD